jgi:uncharacterized protein YjbI with pentapeptide repeats
VQLNGEHLVGRSFADADLVEWETDGCVFEECDFSGARLNASVHRSSAFLRCTFRRTSFFGAELSGCKLTGSVFLEGCELLPLTVDGGDWSYVSLRRQDLHGLSLDGVRLREADLSDSDLRKASLRSCDLGHARLRHAQLAGADLRGADLEGVDLREVDVKGARLDVGQAVQLVQQLGAQVG